MFSIRESDTEAMETGSLTDAACDTVYLGTDDFTITPLGEWTSPASGCTYPMGWDLVILGEQLSVTPVLEDQELRVFPETYWEGAATVSGDATGRAYIELTGYCD